MEKVDIMDINTLTCGERMDIVTPYVGGGHSGQLALLTYTEKVRGSSPFAPTFDSRTNKARDPIEKKCKGMALFN
jgi:hypothetical protein